MKKFTFFSILMSFTFLFATNLQAQDIIDLTGSESSTILADTLSDIPAGAVVLLKPGMVYDAGGHAFTQSVTIKSAEPNNLVLPKINCASNYNFGDGATVDSVIFMNVELFGEYDARYVLNSNVAATVGKLVFDGCYIHDLRGILRMKDSGPGTIDHYIINNSVVSMIRDYGILTVDRNDWMVKNIRFTNSTFSKIRAFMTSKNNTNTIVIDGCSLSEVTAAGQRMFRWREGGQDNVTEGIMIKNTLWGHAWDEDGGGSTGIDGFDGLGATTWTFENTTATSDLEFASGKDTIKGFDKMYAGSSEDLWVNLAEGDLNYKDNMFESIGFAGDPRWSVASEDGGHVWNIGDSAYSGLGTVDMTKTIAGLTLYAHSGKTITIEDNNKTVDDMSFTSRLKFGGSGDFDDNGQPLGRVLSVDVMGNTNITVFAMSSSSGTDRILNIAAGHKDNVIAEFPALGPSLTKGEYFYKGGPTKLYFYSPSSGVNVYYLKTASVPTNTREIQIHGPEVNVYPNPADTRVFVDVNAPTRVGIYNIAGSLMISKLVESKYQAIDVSELKQGMYFIRSLDNKSFAKKLIIK